MQLIRTHPIPLELDRGIMYLLWSLEGMPSTPLWPTLNTWSCLFVLTNAPAVFQALISDALCNMLDRLIFVHLDDNPISPLNQDKHIKYGWLVLQRLLENRHNVKAKKM